MEAGMEGAPLIRFRRTLRLGPVRLNAGLGGIGASIGVRGVHVGVNTRTGSYLSGGAGGLYVMQHLRTAEGEHQVVRHGSVSWLTAFGIAVVFYWVLIFKYC